MIFEFYDIKGSLAYVTTANILSEKKSKGYEFKAPVKHLEEGSYSVKGRVINAKVAPKSIQFSYVEE